MKFASGRFGYKLLVTKKPHPERVGLFLTSYVCLNLLYFFNGLA